MRSILCGETRRIDPPVPNGGSFIIHSSTVNTRRHDSMSVIDLRWWGDFSLHIGIRRAENAIVFNSKPEHGAWGDEKRVSLPSIRGSATLEIQVQHDHFVIRLNGKHLFTYGRRTFTSIACVGYYGGAESFLADRLLLATSTDDTTQPLHQHLFLNHESKLGRALVPGESVVVYSNKVDLSPTGDYTHINLLSEDGDILFHMSIRVTESEIVFNTQLRDGAWGAEDRIPLPNIFNGARATIAIRLQGSNWLTSVNGRLIKTFSQRIFKRAVTVAYGSGDNNTVFSDPVFVMIATPDENSLPFLVSTAADTTRLKQSIGRLSEGDTGVPAENQPRV